MFTILSLKKILEKKQKSTFSWHAKWEKNQFTKSIYYIIFFYAHPKIYSKCLWGLSLKTGVVGNFIFFVLLICILFSFLYYETQYSHKRAFIMYVHSLQENDKMKTHTLISKPI